MGFDRKILIEHMPRRWNGACKRRTCVEPASHGYASYSRCKHLSLSMKPICALPSSFCIDVLLFLLKAQCDHATPTTMPFLPRRD